jgi:hypothetical protein
MLPGGSQPAVREEVWLGATSGASALRRILRWRLRLLGAPLLQEVEQALPGLGECPAIRFARHLAVASNRGVADEVARAPTGGDAGVTGGSEHPEDLEAVLDKQKAERQAPPKTSAAPPTGADPAEEVITMSGATDAYLAELEEAEARAAGLFEEPARTAPVWTSVPAR